MANLMAESAMLTGHDREAVDRADEALRLSGASPASAALAAAIAVNKGSRLSGIPGRDVRSRGVAARRSGRGGGGAGLPVGVARHQQPGPHRVPALARGARRRPRTGWGALSSVAAGRTGGRRGISCGDRPRPPCWATWSPPREKFALARIPPSQRSWCSLASAELALETGDVKEAKQLLGAFEDMMTPGNQGEERVVAAGLRVRYAAMAGDMAAMRLALAALVDVYRGSRPDHESGSGDLWYHALVSVLRAGLPVEEVEALMAAAAGAARPVPGRRHAMRPARARQRPSPARRSC